jgi:hypothetical protein
MMSKTGISKMRKRFYKGFRHMNLNSSLLALMLFSATAISSETFSPPGCEYSVEFAAAPEIKSKYVPSLGEYPSASHYSGDSFVRAECHRAESIALRNSVRSKLEEYVNANGLQYATYEFQDTQLGYLAKARGYKKAAGLQGTFHILIYIGQSSMLTLYTGGASSSYPTSQVFDFLASVKNGS